MAHAPLLSQTGLFGRLVVLVGLMAAGMLLISIPILLIPVFSGQLPEEFLLSPSFLKGMQFTQALSLFVLPTVLMAYLISPAPWRFLGLNKAPGWRNSMLTLASMIAIMPCMEMIIKWNEAITFPAFLAPAEDWMRMKELQAQEAMNLILTTGSITGWLINLLLVGVTAAISEELFFRGMLQNLFLNKWHKKIAAVALAAFIFSAIHFQFYGFIPRFLLGAYFGFLLIRTGNLWLPILAHFINNATALVQIFLQQRNIITEDFYTPAPWAAYTLAIAGLLLFTGIAYQIKKSGTLN